MSLHDAMLDEGVLLRMQLRQCTSLPPAESRETVCEKENVRLLPRAMSTTATMSAQQGANKSSSSIGSNFFGSSGAGSKEPTVWLDELREQHKSDRILQESIDPNPLIERYNVPHRFTEEERKRMDKYESIDYWEPQTLVYKDHLRDRRKQRRWTKWFVYSAVGLLVGLVAVCFFQTLELVSSLKQEALEKVIEDAAHNIKRDPNWIHTHSRIRSGAPTAAVMRGYGVWMAWSCLSVLFSSLCCVWMPSAAGSGVPEVMAFLNGVQLPKLFNIRTLLAKLLSCMLAVTGGLPVGAEGPMIHTGAIIGAGLPTGRSRTLRCSFGSILKMFRNSKDHRDFVTAGSAAGVTAAFGAPIGGLLFVMEEIASFFPAKLGWLIFVTCLGCTFTINVVNSFFKNWSLRDRSGVATGSLKDSVVTLFNTDFATQHVPMDLATFLPTVVIGLLFGVIGTLFTMMNIKVLRLRGKYIVPSTAKRVAEPLVVIIIYATISYFLPFAFECKPLPQKLIDSPDHDLEFVTAFCGEPEKEFNPMATLTLTNAYNVIKILYTRYTGDLIPWECLVVFQLLFTVGASYCGGMFLAGGIIIPTLMVGAIGGRAVGVWFNQPWADAGVCSLIGSAAFFGGLSRLTFSMVVIMMEITNDLTHIATLMTASFISKIIADRFCHSLYHGILEVKCVPYLDVQTRVHHLDTHSARDIMSPKPVSLPTISKISAIVQTLRACDHNCFPIVSVADQKTFKGTVQRSQLEVLLWYLHLRDTQEYMVADVTSHASYNDLQEIKERIFWSRLPPIPDMSAVSLQQNLDLNPYIDTGAFFCHERLSISKAYDLFRNMGLRHLVVIDQRNYVTGIISRKNLVGDRMTDALKTAAASPRGTS